MLTGKFTRDSVFAEDDHRKFNRKGRRLIGAKHFPVWSTKPPFTLSKACAPWSARPDSGATGTPLDTDVSGITCAIPGAKRPEQVEENVKAADLPPLSDATMAEIDDLYDRHVRAHVHHYW